MRTKQLNQFYGYQLYGLISIFVLCMFLTACRKQNKDENIDEHIFLRKIRSETFLEDVDSDNHLNFVYYNNDIQNDKLLVFLGGTFSRPEMHTYFPIGAARLGYSVINLAYPNNTSSQSCSSSSDSLCHLNYHREVIYGDNVSDVVSINKANCISNRLLRLLNHLDMIAPEENWDNFYSGESLRYGQIVFVGHSQGGGHAAFIGYEHEVNRVITFASPNDFDDIRNRPAHWLTKISQTNPARMYSFLHLNDEVVDFNIQYESIIIIGKDSFRDTSLVDNKTSFISNNLYTKRTPASGFLNNQRFHGSVVLDNATPLNSNNTPYFEKVWNYLLEEGKK